MLDAALRAKPRDGTALFMHRAANTFQRLAQGLGTPDVHFDPLAIAREIPEPRSPVEVALLKYLAYEAAYVTLHASGAHHVSFETALSVLAAVGHVRDSASSAAMGSLFDALSRATDAGRQHSIEDQFVSYAEACYAQRLTVAAIAAHFGVTPRTLNRLCIRHLGMPMRDYVRAVRVRHGLALVAQGMKVESAATAVGYRSKKDFYHAVRLITGLTPARSLAGQAERGVVT